jgi:hypothetical protein
VLLDLSGFRVVEVRRVEDEPGRESRLVLVETVAPVAACPVCGVLAGRVHERPQVQVKDLPVGSGQLRLVWRKRRYRSEQLECARRWFTETRAQVPGRARLTERLRERLADAVGTPNRAVSDVAGEYGVAWWTVQRGRRRRPRPTAAERARPRRSASTSPRRAARVGCWRRAPRSRPGGAATRG